MRNITKSKCRSSNWRYFLLLLVLLAVVGLVLPVQYEASTSPPASKNSPPVVMTLRADNTNHIRAFCNGMPLFVSLGGIFEFYKTDFLYRRTRVAIGPWEGLLKSRLSARSTASYDLTGRDAGSGATSDIEFRQVDSSTLEITFSFTAPDQATHLSFEIGKVAMDFCRKASLASSPASLADAGTIPLKSLAFGEHILLKNKNTVIFRTPLSDLEITDLQNAKTILVADLRNAPWDRKKSVSVSAEGIPVTPGKTHTFRYRIRLLPPTALVMNRAVAASASSVNSTVIENQVGIAPKEETKAVGSFVLKQSDSIYGSVSGTAETELQRDLQRLTGLSLPVRSISPGKGIVIERDSSTGRLPAEGFEIITTPDRVVIRGADSRGCLYGVYAMTSRLVKDGAGWKVPCGSIRDWPDMSVRGMCLELLPPSIHDINLMKRYLSALSHFRCNLVIFLHSPRQLLAWQRKKDDGGWSKKEIQDIAAYARSLQMEVWGGMGSGFDPASFPTLKIPQGANIYDPTNNTSYDVIFSLYSEIIQAYQPSVLMISHDEMSGLNLFARKSNRATADIFASDVNKNHRWLAARGVKTAMWGDMLLDYQTWNANLGNANSQNPPFNSGATHLAIDKIAKDVMILDWHYGNHSEYRSIEYFRNRGFTVFGSPWYDPRAAINLAKSVKMFKGAGVIGTDWGFWRTLSPTSTTIYTLLGGWSTTLSVDQSDADLMALAGMLRDDIYAQIPLKQTTANLADYGNRSSRHAAPGAGKGLFEKGAALNLQTLLPGRLVLGGISFDRVSNINSYCNNCVVAGNSDDQLSSLNAEKTIFRGDAHARAIAYLHTCFIEEPQYNVRKLGSYLVEYENGSIEKIDLQENWNITDIRSSEGLRQNSWSFSRSPDVLIGSKLAWRASSASGIPLNVQMFIWKNPHPKRKIQSIRLNVAKAPLNSQIAVLGLTFLQ